MLSNLVRQSSDVCDDDSKCLQVRECAQVSATAQGRLRPWTGAFALLHRQSLQCITDTSCSVSQTLLAVCHRQSLQYVTDTPCSVPQTLLAVRHIMPVKLYRAKPILAVRKDLEYSSCAWQASVEMMQAGKLLSQNNHRPATMKLFAHLRGPPQPARANVRVSLLVSVQEVFEATKACSVVGHHCKRTLMYLCLCRKRMKPRKQPSVLKPCKQVRPCHGHPLLRPPPSLCSSACVCWRACVRTYARLCTLPHLSDDVMTPHACRNEVGGEAQLWVTVDVRMQG